MLPLLHKFWQFLGPHMIVTTLISIATTAFQIKSTCLQPKGDPSQFTKSFILHTYHVWFIGPLMRKGTFLAILTAAAHKIPAE